MALDIQSPAQTPWLLLAENVLCIAGDMAWVYTIGSHPQLDCGGAVMTSCTDAQ